MKLFTSHESLLLSYEEALTRIDSTSGKWYDCSAHMLWVGDRTRDINGAHINFLSGLANPIGLKVGPTLGTDDLLKLIDKLNPENEKGRLTLITRLGHDNVSKMLPQLLKKIKSEGKNVNWFCDPMHANTIKSSTNYKTRPFKNILKDKKIFFDIHKSENTVASGVHFEMTGQEVTECTGGAQEISDEKLGDRYRTYCDPRLNASAVKNTISSACEALRRGSQYVL
jgi:3-deoxy-7-phosphoheptulonate synthase